MESLPCSPLNLPLLWLCNGDFNELLSNNEKFERCVSAKGKTQKFRDALSDCELHDLGFQGYWFTWWNKRYEDEMIKERLNRAVANT